MIGKARLVVRVALAPSLIPSANGSVRRATYQLTLYDICYTSRPDRCMAVLRRVPSTKGTLSGPVLFLNSNQQEAFKLHAVQETKGHWLTSCCGSHMRAVRAPRCGPIYLTRHI